MSLFSQKSSPDLTVPLTRLEEQVQYLAEQVQALQNAYNAFFDVVAEDLGYQTRLVYVYPHLHYLGLQLSNPRLLAETITPEMRKVIRNPTARCAGKKAPSAKEK